MSGINKQKIIDGLNGLNKKITMFADGFVDEVWEIVNTRTGPKDFSVYNQKKQFTDRITKSGTGGLGLEIVKKRRAFGGFTANIGYAAARLGVDTAMVGVYGKEKLDPIFEPINDICRVISLGDPAVTHVFEFDDGKILMSYMEAVQDINWDNIVNMIGMEKINQLLIESDVIGVGYWSLLPAFDEIVSQICAHLPQDNKTRRLFFDFADFLKKDSASLTHSLGILKTLNENAPMTLSLNEHEAAALFSMCNETMGDEPKLIPDTLENVRKSLGMDELVIHTPHYSQQPGIPIKRIPLPH